MVIKIIIALLLCCSSAFATTSQIHQVLGMAKAAGGVSYYYPPDLTSSSFTTSSAQGTSNANGAYITAGQTGNINSLGVYVTSVGSATAIKIALFQASNKEAAISATYTINNPVLGWNYIAITPYSVTDGSTYLVGAIGNASWELGYSATGTGYYWYDGYSSFAASTVSIATDSGKTYGVSFGME